MVKFSELGLSEEFLKNLEHFKYEEPTEIQEKAIPLVLQGEDILGGSATGSGKTLAFGAGIIEKITHGEGIKALVLTPTRELAEQVCVSLRDFSSYKRLNVAPVYGGVAMGPQIDNLKFADIVVATPGRLLDHIQQRTVNLSQVKYLILDEADRMLDMGFLPDVTRIIQYCPKERQTLLFSATASHEILQIAGRYMKHPKEIAVQNYVDPSKLTQVFYDVQINEKFSLLVQLLRQENSKLVMIFCNTKRVADFIAKNLRLQNIDAMPLHGDLSQNKRQQVLNQFHKSEKFVLVCTDVAARGLDIKEVSHVYNYDIPKNPLDYIHRIGRTARAGKEGKAINIVASNDYENFGRVIRGNDFEIKREDNPKFEILMIQSSSRRDFGRDSRGRSRDGFSRRDSSSPRGYHSNSPRGDFRERRPYRSHGEESSSEGGESRGLGRPRRSSYHSRDSSRSRDGPRSYRPRRTHY